MTILQKILSFLLTKNLPFDGNDTSISQTKCEATSINLKETSMDASCQYTQGDHGK